MYSNFWIKGKIYSKLIPRIVVLPFFILGENLWLNPFSIYQSLKKDKAVTASKLKHKSFF